ncbi:MAG: regulatory protein RecX [Kordiimonas sp.]
MSKPAKKVTKGYLERAALHYLGRFSATEAHLRQVLERKVRRRNEGNEPASAEQLNWIAAVAQKCVRMGYVDDELYARSRFESLLRKGKAKRLIQQDLQHKGVPAEIIRNILAEAEDDPDVDLNLSAAAAYIKRRRFGAFRRADRMSEEKIEKEKASMMRAGFSYGIISRLLESTEEEVLALLP